MDEKQIAGIELRIKQGADTMRSDMLALIAEVRRLRDFICGPTIAAIPQDLLDERLRRQAEGLRNVAPLGRSA